MAVASDRSLPEVIVGDPGANGIVRPPLVISSMHVSESPCAVTESLAVDSSGVLLIESHGIFAVAPGIRTA